MELLPLPLWFLSVLCIMTICSVSLLYMNASLYIFNLLQVNATAQSAYPPVAKPAGLSHDRQTYLYREIREFVAEEHRDLVCPPPKSMSSSIDHELSDDETVIDEVDTSVNAASAEPTDYEPAAKRGRGRPRKGPRGRGRGRPPKKYQ